MAPPYFEYLSVRKIIESIATEHGAPEFSASDIRRRVSSQFNTNQIYELNYKDVKVFDKSGKKYIDANYEVRIPIMWKIDAVLKFNDLLYQVGGDGRPVTNFPPTKK
jgi:hypothetical protein